MRRALACLLVLAAPASARVVRLPAVVRACEGDLAWDAVMKCTGTLGDAKLARSVGHGRLVRVTGHGEEQAAAPGVYLFTETAGTWHLGGMYEGTGELLGFDRPTLGTHPVYRFELGFSEHSETTLDGVTSVPDVIVLREQAYCTGEGYRCSFAMTSCDVLVAGKAVATFRGTVTWKDSTLHVSGDRSHAGVECAAPAEVPVDF